MRVVRQAGCVVAGSRDGWNAPTLPVPPTVHADATPMSERPDDAIFVGAWVLDGSPMMPPFGDMLTAEQIRALVRHSATAAALLGRHS